MNENNFLALDLGTSFGWAHCVGGKIESGSVRTQVSKRVHEKYLFFARWLEDKILSYKYDKIYFELVPSVRTFKGANAAFTYGNFLLFLKIMCDTCNIEYCGVVPSVIKKHITGKGNANKKSVIAEVRTLGFNPVDSNEADALALLNYVINTKSGFQK